MQKMLVYRISLLALGWLVSACGGDVQSVEEAPGLPHQALQTEPPAEFLLKADMSIQGQLTYDRVQFASRRHQGLDYNQINRLPLRGVTVELLDEQGRLLGRTQSDADGFYRLKAKQGQQVQVRVKAELRGIEQAAWDIQVRDNTQQNAQYTLDGALASSGQGEQQTRNLHAASGWTGKHYGAPRSAGPFAILDSIYDGIQTVVRADPHILLPPLNIFWSERNITTRGSLAEGHIGTSFFTSAGPSIYLLGTEDNDSDEYDRAVVQHEFGHYLEHQLGRTDSIGGRHSQSVKLDMRVAFGEAFGNAFAGLASGDPVYRDSMGQQQSWGYAFDVQQRPNREQGWFSQATVQAILYQLADDRGPGHLGLGFTSIYQALTSEEYQKFQGFTSIYALIAQLQAQHPERAAAIGELVRSFNIHGTGWYGEGETNNAGSPIVLPIYHKAYLNQTLNLCSDNRLQDYNGADVRRFVRLHLPQTRSYHINATKTHSSIGSTNPQLRIHRQGREVASILNGTPDREEAQRYLEAGHYIFEIYEQSNVDRNSNSGGLACFDVTVS